MQVVYPDNPYMPLFAGVGYVLLGNRDSANRHLEKAKENLWASEYWTNRFSQFGLTGLINDFPQDAEEAEEVLESMRDRYLEWIR